MFEITCMVYVAWKKVAQEGVNAGVCLISMQGRDWFSGEEGCSCYDVRTLVHVINNGCLRSIALGPHIPHSSCSSKKKAILSRSDCLHHLSTDHGVQTVNKRFLLELYRLLVTSLPQEWPHVFHIKRPTVHQSPQHQGAPNYSHYILKKKKKHSSLRKTFKR